MVGFVSVLVESKAEYSGIMYSPNVTILSYLNFVVKTQADDIFIMRHVNAYLCY